MNTAPVASAPLSLIDQLAEHLAEGATVPDAAQRLGINTGYANSLLQRMRKRLGAQAV